MSSFGFTEIKQNKFRCDTCGELVNSGIINISEHYVKCEGKELFEEIKNIDKSEFSTEEKIELVKALYKLNL